MCVVRTAAHQAVITKAVMGIDSCPQSVIIKPPAFHFLYFFYLMHFLLGHPEEFAQTHTYTQKHLLTVK